MKFSAVTSDLLARITLTLISSFAITSYFQKVNFQGFNLVILNFQLPSAFLYALYEQCSDRCIKVTSKLILPSISRVNQFEMKDMCFEFVINVSRQGDNVKIKLNLKNLVTIRM